MWLGCIEFYSIVIDLANLFGSRSLVQQSKRCVCVCVCVCVPRYQATRLTLSLILQRQKSRWSQWTLSVLRQLVAQRWTSWKIRPSQVRWAWQVEDELLVNVGNHHPKTVATKSHKMLWSKTVLLRKGRRKTCHRCSTQLYKAARRKQYMKQYVKKLTILTQVKNKN